MKAVARVLLSALAAVGGLIVQNFLIEKPVQVDAAGQAVTDPFQLLWWVITLVAFPVMAFVATWRGTA
jgi:hypothetical protein